MIRKLSMLTGLLFLRSLTAQAQDVSDKVELFGGYSYTRTDLPSGNVNGWDLQGDYLPTWFGNAREDNARLSSGIVIHF